MKATIFSGWHLMRFLRLGMGSLMIVQSFQMHDKLIGVLALFLLYQAIFNKGCCGANACTTDIPHKKSEQTEDISFEEIK
jgi:hypothetical protein